MLLAQPVAARPLAAARRPSARVAGPRRLSSRIHAEQKQTGALGEEAEWEHRSWGALLLVRWSGQLQGLRTHLLAAITHDQPSPGRRRRRRRRGSRLLPGGALHVHPPAAIGPMCCPAGRVYLPLHLQQQATAACGWACARRLLPDRSDRAPVPLPAAPSHTAPAPESVDDSNIVEFCFIGPDGKRQKLSLGEKEQLFLEALSVSGGRVLACVGARRKSALRGPGGI